MDRFCNTIASVAFVHSILVNKHRTMLHRTFFDHFGTRLIDLRTFFGIKVQQRLFYLQISYRFQNVRASTRLSKELGSVSCKAYLVIFKLFLPMPEYHPKETGV